MDISTYEVITIAGWDMTGFWQWATWPIIVAVAVLFATLVSGIVDAQWRAHGIAWGIAFAAAVGFFVAGTFVSENHIQVTTEDAIASVGLYDVQFDGYDGFRAVDKETDQIVRGGLVHIGGEKWAVVRLDPIDVKQYGQYN